MKSGNQTSDTLFEIEIFETSERAGGRLALAEVHGNLYEVGGSVLHPENSYMRHFVDILGERFCKPINYLIKICVA